MVTMHHRGPVWKYILCKHVVAICGGASFLFFLFAVYQVTSHIYYENEEGWSSDLILGPKNIPTFLPKQVDHVVKSNNTIIKSEQSKTQPRGMRKIYESKLLLKSLPSSVYRNDSGPLNNEVTVVTMYINIGSFQKGDPSTYFTPKLYHKWMRIFGFIDNPVLAFFDNQDDKTYFENIRRRFDPTLKNTETVLINREELWAFSLLDKITEIYNEPHYPKHLPNTVIPEYSCAMHAKYEFMQLAVKTNLFHTKYFAWLDIGLFRSEAMSDFLPRIHIWIPPGYNENEVAYTEVYERNTKARPRSIVLGNMVWLCGCFFFGAKKPVETLTHEYMKATEALLGNWSLMNTDQQVLYVLYNAGHPRVQIQGYKPDGRFIEWFHLGYLCKEEGDKLRKIREDSDIWKF